MQHLFIRLLVALVTFGVGLGASALWNTLRPAKQVRSCAASFGKFPRAAVDVPPPPPAAAEGSRTVSGGILQSKAISKTTPAYPETAKAARASGTVVVDIVVAEDGRVESASAASGHPLLRQAAADAVRQWRFSPTLLSGQPVKVSGKVTVNFPLQ